MRWWIYFYTPNPPFPHPFPSSPPTSPPPILLPPPLPSSPPPPSPLGPPRCFLITPKLLKDLDYGSCCSVHCIMNGHHVDSVNGIPGESCGPAWQRSKSECPFISNPAQPLFATPSRTKLFRHLHTGCLLWCDGAASHFTLACLCRLQGWVLAVPSSVLG